MRAAAGAGLAAGPIPDDRHRTAREDPVGPVASPGRVGWIGRGDRRRALPRHPLPRAGLRRATRGPRPPPRSARTRGGVVRLTLGAPEHARVPPESLNGSERATGASTMFRPKTDCEGYRRRDFLRVGVAGM